MQVTIYDIAKKANVSAMTVSRVLNNKNTRIAVSKATEQKVRKIAEELDYTPDFTARALRKGQSSLIGVIVPNVTFSYLPEVVEGIESILREKQSSILLCTTEMDIDKEIEYLKMLHAKKVDGLIMWPSGTEAQIGKHIQPFTKKNKPVVFIYRKLFLPETKRIYVDTYAGAYKATSYLIEKGHTRIASRLLPDMNPDIFAMISGHNDALKDHGIKINRHLLKPMGTYEQTYKSVSELLKNEQPPTAIYTTGDYQAFGAINAIQDAGLNVPDDIAVIGNNDIECAAMYNPPLSSVKIPKREVGILAAKIMLGFLDEKEICDYDLKPELIIRKSS